MQNSNTIEKRSQSTRQLVYMGVAIALCVVATMVLIPMPGGAMVHMGSAALYIIGIVFGRWVGAVGGGIGSMIFDAIVGLTGYTPFSLVIKGVAGYLVGYFGYTPNRRPSYGRVLIATLIASLWTLVGYIVAWWAVIGSWQAAIANIPFSLMTSALGIVVALAVGPKLYELIHKRK